MLAYFSFPLKSPALKLPRECFPVAPTIQRKQLCGLGVALDDVNYLTLEYPIMTARGSEVGSC